MQFDERRLLIHWVNRLAFLTQKEMKQRFDSHRINITPKESAILLQLPDQAGVTPGELANNTVRDRSTVTRLLDKMAGKKLVRRVTGSEDRREVRIWLTAQGKKTKKKLIPIGSQLISKAHVDIPQKDIDTTIQTLQKMYQNILDDSE